MLKRGPFKVKREGRTRWKIVRADGTDERLGFATNAAAAETCRLMNSDEDKEEQREA